MRYTSQIRNCYAKSFVIVNYTMISKSYIWLLIWALFIGSCAYLIPYFTNDYRYLMIQGTDDLVKSFSDIIVSQWRHYFEWGGRTPAHLIAQILLYAGKGFSAFASAFCYITLILFIYYHAYGIKPTLKGLKFIPLFFITMSLWLFLRIYGEVVFMLVSSCNYMFTTTIVLIFLLPYRLSIKKEKQSGSIPFAILMFILGVIAGWCNENTSFAACFVVGILGLYLLKQKRLTLWQITGGIGAGIGFLLLVLSPGNEARLQFMEDAGFDFWTHLPAALAIYAYSLLENLPLLLLLVFCTYKVLKNNYHKQFKYQWYGALWLFLMSFSSLSIMIFSPNFPARSASPFTIFLIPAVIAMAMILIKNQGSIVNKKLSSILVALALVYAIPTMANTLYCYKIAHEDDQERSLEIKTQIDAGILDLVVKPMRVQTSKYVFIGDVRAQKQYFGNLIIAKYYHVDSIRRSCNYKFPSTISHDYAFFQTPKEEGVCSLDRGDPEDPNDKLNIEYLKTHPEEKAKLDFRHYKKS